MKYTLKCDLEESPSPCHGFNHARICRSHRSRAGGLVDQDGGLYAARRNACCGRGHGLLFARRVGRLRRRRFDAATWRVEGGGLPDDGVFVAARAAGSEVSQGGGVVARPFSLQRAAEHDAFAARVFAVLAQLATGLVAFTNDYEGRHIHLARLVRG